MNRRSWLTFNARGAMAALLGKLSLQAENAMAEAQNKGPQAARKPQKTPEGRVYRERVLPHWFANNTHFWYRNDLPEGRREFILVDALAGTREPAFDHARLAKALSQATGKEVNADHLPIEGLDFRDDKTSVLVYNGAHAWELDLPTYTLQEWKGPIPALSSLPGRRHPHPSDRTGPETTVTFINQTAGDVLMFWIDPDGQRKPYGEIRPGERYEQHTFAGHVWLLTDHKDHTLGVFEAAELPGTAVVDGKLPEEHQEKNNYPADSNQPGGAHSPDGEWTAFIRDHNVWLHQRANGQETALTQNGRQEDYYNQDLFWSPDSRKLVALKTRAGEEHKVHFIESSPPDQVQPRLHTIDYLKPGDRIDSTRPHLFDAASGKGIPVEDTLFPNPWEISDIRWEPDSRRFTFFYNQRGHQVLRIIAIDAQSGKSQAIIEEQSKTFIDYAGKRFVEYLDTTGEMIWMSERDGWNHLYLYDARAGRVKNQLTTGKWVVRGVDRVDPDKRQVWFRAGGVYPDQDPYYIHYCRVNFDGTGLTRMTEGDGAHSMNYSPDHRFFIDTYSRVDLPPVNELRRTEDGKLICRLETADASELVAGGWHMPERFVAKGRDGKTDIYGVIIRPTGFDPTVRYPVIENIYAGPQASYVPKAWSTHYGMQEIARPGFIVVQMDGMGTSNRSKAFHDVCWKNLADAGFPDRISWIQAAARKYPYLDLSRVGIYGGSAGGQNALGALLFHGEFYKAAVADCGCHDNRMDKIWWNELWMGWPVGPEYAEQSNVTNAHRLQGKLMLIVAEMDTNVDPASTMQVVNALVKADKDFELLVIPGANHGCAETPYGSRRRLDFFIKHLLKNA